MSFRDDRAALLGRVAALEAELGREREGSAAQRELAGELDTLAAQVRTATGEVRAFSAQCTHLNCTVQYRGDFQHIWCACHNGHYDLQGKNIEGPPPRPLDTYEVDVAGDDIYVTKGA